MRIVLMAGVAGALTALTAGCNWTKPKEGPRAQTPKEIAAARDETIRKACASDATYDRLKELVFDEAARIRNADARNLDPLAASSVVRMEEPLVKSRDEGLNVTVCTGKFILELPPGAENAFDGMRRLNANVEYAAQAAADGSGLVYHMDGAEPIIYRLASFGLNGQAPMPRIIAGTQSSGPPAVPPQDVAKAESAPMPPAPAPAPAPGAAAPAPRAAIPARAPVPAPAPPKPAPRVVVRPVERPRPAEAPAPASLAAKPAFNCRYAHTRSERLICGSPALAGRDRTMSSVYYSTIARADPDTKNRIRASRDAFLRRRERCGSEECVARAYEERIREIRSLSGE